MLNQPNGRKHSGNVKGFPPDVRKSQEDGEPGWASGLRKLYNSVVDEPLPDSFQDLLKKLDDSDDA
ncbi:NepR family anti-sigma factor [Novosphingobium malaysiense]|uniref:NepR family anti-sigma factor n=1 Tax=Novosphingobium malaysiense TaxID=1348853 RepID=UPI0038B27EFB